MIVGIDTGGTFTDVVRRGDDGSLEIYKLLSTPDDPSRAIGEGYGEVETGGERLIHGTTVATNALLERAGGKLAFVTTAGFEDLLSLQRQNRPDLYALDIRKPVALAAREDCFGVRERMSASGEVIVELEEARIDELAERLEQGDYEAVAVCLLHAYANAEHEARLVEGLRERLDGIPEASVSASHEVIGQFREYERASTTCVNAYVAPVMGRYLERLDDRVPAEDIQVLQSSGGRVDLEHAARFPVHTALSGPAGGVVGAKAAGGQAGFERVMSLDMGGTSTDVSLCKEELTLTNEADIDGLPVHVPVIDIHTVGAGGGSIAHVDPGGVLRVGPESAGADPGPACYGRGGREPTVTDAHVVLGRIRPGHFLGGRMSLDVAEAEAAVGGLAEQLEVGLREAARGILEVADAKMSRALKVISLERGHDPRDFTLVAFGGAGALHACRLAESLDMQRVLVPKNPGVLSAWGMLHADFQRLVGRTVLRPLSDALETPEELADTLGAMRREAVGDLEVEPDSFDWEPVAQLRYEGQSFEIDVPVDWRWEDLAAGKRPSDPTEAFEQAHERMYGYRADQRDVELVGLRLTARRPGPELPAEAAAVTAADTVEPRERRHTEVGFADGDAEALIVDRRTIEDGEAFDGPAVITEYSGTTVVPPGWSVESRGGHLVIRKS